MVMNVTGSVPITTQDGKPTGLSLGVGTNATEPQVGSRNWKGSSSNKKVNPESPGFWGSLGSSLGHGIGQAAGTAMTLGVMALFGFAFA
jgi:hypothetical protein